MGEAVLTVILGILYYAVVIIAIGGTAYSYLKTLDFSRPLIMALEQRAAATPHLMIIIFLINWCKYITIPALIWGLIWYAQYAKLTV
jgi:hypothetical protein